MSIYQYWQQMKEAIARGDYICAARCGAQMMVMICDVLHPDCPIPPTPVMGDRETLISELDAQLTTQGKVDWGLVLKMILALLQTL